MEVKVTLLIELERNDDQVRSSVALITWTAADQFLCSMYCALNFFDKAIVLESTVLMEVMIEKKTSWKMDSEDVVVVSVELDELSKLSLTISVEVDETWRHVSM